jgi:transcriptional regulator with XRE-family HTH domain
MELHLQRIRKSRGLSQQDMAERVNVKKRTYGSWERGEANMSLAQAFDCAVALDCSIDEIAGHEVPHTFSDPRQAELNRCWESSTTQRQDALLMTARDFAGASKEGAERHTAPDEEAV